MIMQNRSDKYTLRDVARMADVSTATASRAFNKNSYIREATRRKVLEVAENLNYRPSFSAQNLAFRRAGRINNKGAVKLFTRRLFEYGHSFYIEIVKGVINTLNQHGLEAAISEFMEDDIPRCENWAFKDSLCMDAVIFIGTAPENAVRYFVDYPVPVLLIDEAPRFDNLPWIGIDNFSGIKDLVGHLVGLGYRRIAFAGGMLFGYSVQERLDAFRIAVAEYGLDPAFTPVISCGQTMDSAYKTWLQLLAADSLRNIDAVIAINDVIGVGIVKACNVSGISIPDKFGVATFDGSSFCNYSPIPMTTMKVPTYEMGREAAQMIIASLKLNCGFHSRVSVMPELVLGETCSLRPRS